MRCKNCGWENPPENNVCIKCHAPFLEAEAGGGRATVHEVNVGNAETVPSPTNHEGNECPDCGYPLMPGNVFCPRCGGNVGVREKAKGNVPVPKPAPVPVMGVGGETVMPGKRRTHCTLTLLDDDGKEETSRSFIGDEITLNRANTDPDNNTITSKVQAVLTYSDNRWFIQDKSGLQTTYIRPAEKMEIKDGDVILLGDRKIVFNGQ